MEKNETQVRDARPVLDGAKAEASLGDIVAAIDRNTEMMQRAVQRLSSAIHSSASVISGEEYR
jgi:hypothetical protein